MKALHTLRFVNNATVELTKYENRITSSETYEKAKDAARQMLGYIDCLITFNNTMICVENNDFTGDFDEVINDWTVRVYQLLIDKAVETKQDHDVVWTLLRKRDEFANA